MEEVKNCYDDVRDFEESHPEKKGMVSIVNDHVRVNDRVVAPKEFTYWVLRTVEALIYSSGLADDFSKELNQALEVDCLAEERKLAEIKQILDNNYSAANNEFLISYLIRSEVSKAKIQVMQNTFMHIDMLNERRK